MGPGKPASGVLLTALSTPLSIDPRDPAGAPPPPDASPPDAPAEPAAEPITEAGASAPPEAADDRPLRWQVHLARTQPAKTLGVLLTVVLSAALCFYLFRNWIFVLFTIVALVGATAEFLFPVRYLVDASGAEMRNLHNWRRINWGEVRKAYLLEEGIKLSPLPVRSRLEAFRGVMLRFGAEPGDRETVLAAVRKYRDGVRRNADG